MGVLRSWWGRFPHANVGLVIGKGRVVIDIDPKSGGLETWTELAHALGAEDLCTPTAISGSGGRHYWFALDHRTQINSGASALGPGVDVLRNGLIVVEPSLHASGRLYTWAPRRSILAIQPAPLPIRILDLLRPPTARAPLRTPANVARPGAYGGAALERELRAVRASTEGTRNDTLNRAGFNLGQLVAEGILDEALVRQALREAAREVGLR